ncbi:MAG: LPS export ABC transporter periplasmic protein LptC [Glaciecola sp.]|jgi:lipopolysaccharide export system protein LptC|nr:LPS export ABC transporter periplasmic protein LptC [Glaciecola sp.]MDG1815589.1 LPS export ABC transporter periplasmic protein LptC [Glaciecola sp.]MDG2100547.1 LPS export ABC transporter periplasmic protein LptC [Glaciecola sp.]
MNRVGYSILLLFTCIAALYFYPLDDATQQSSAGERSQIFETPTYRAENLTSQRYAADGTLSHKVFAKVMEQYDNLGFMVFEYPRYTIYLNEVSPYIVTADVGTLFSNNVIRLEKNIRITSLNKTDFIQQISTEFIEIDLTTNTMFSDKEVLMTGAEFSMLSHGFNADMQTKTFNLTGHVKTEFAANSAVPL